MVEATLATSARVTSKDSLSDLFEPSTKSGQDQFEGRHFRWPQLRRQISLDVQQLLQRNIPPMCVPISILRAKPKLLFSLPSSHISSPIESYRKAVNWKRLILS